jgi:hypothetical protein
MRPTDKIGWNRTRESAWERVFAQHLIAGDGYTLLQHTPQPDEGLGRMGEPSISRRPSVASNDDCPYCGAENVGPAHHGFAPALCKETR